LYLTRFLLNTYHGEFKEGLKGRKKENSRSAKNLITLFFVSAASHPYHRGLDSMGEERSQKCCWSPPQR
jgi:hypothetical protein